MQTTRNEIATIISEALTCDFGPVEDAYVFKGGYLPASSSLLPVTFGQLDELASTIGQYREVSPASAATDITYEVVVQAESRFPVSRMPDDGIRMDDLQSGVGYELNYGSAAFLIFLALKLREQAGDRWRRNVRMSYSMRDRLRDSPIETLTAFRSVMRIRTLRIVSSAPRAVDSWKPYADAAFFQLGYNLDLAIVPQSEIRHLVEPSKIRGMRRSTIGELDPPRRHYVNDLVHHYQLGISADSAMLKYLSYYHVAEHFFESIFQDDLAEQVQTLITSPDFSYRRKRDIRNLIRRVSRATQIRDEEVIINEQVALRLTLAKYVDPTRLLADLNEFDPTLVARYANSAVSFSGGDIVDLSAHSSTDLVASLSRRIYKTRNSLVHSKDGSKGKFIPFAHDAELTLEVPLVRFVAEQIIVATSSMMPSGG